jgi:hypothetical protein
MRPFQLKHSISGKVAFAGALLVVALKSAAFAGDSGEAEANAELKNLARMNCGARIECTTPAGRVDVLPITRNKETAAALIMDDQTVGCALAEGDTTFVISLPKASLLNRFTFVNENAQAEGDMRIAVSNYQLPAASPKWTPVDGTINFAHKRVFNLSMLGVEAKYVRIAFRVAKPGRIAAFGLYGDETLKAFAKRNSHVVKVANISVAKNSNNALNYNLANIYARSHVVYVSSGAADSAKRMIDDDPASSFAFSPGDPRPTVILELAEMARVHRVSALYKMQAGRLDIYALDKLPSNPSDLSGVKPVATVTDITTGGKAAVDFDPRGARYIALVWSQDGADVPAEGFEVAELGAFGNVSLASLNLAPEDLLASNSITPASPGQGGLDFSNKLGTIAEPPTLPAVSP